MRRRDAGVTLIEIMVAMTLLSLLSVGMVIAIRVGLSAYTKTDTRLMDNRRVAGAQRILQQELNGLLPAYVSCGTARAVLFQGAPDTMWLASTFSVQRGWRGQPQILEIFVIPGDGGGVRLVVNEMPYTGARGAGQYCAGSTNAPGSISRLAQFLPMRAGPSSFVLADKLAFCHFSYQTPVGIFNQPPTWEASWASKGWPLAVRIDMAPLSPDPTRLQPISVTAPLHIRRDPEKVYVDEY
jgi:prepilin-type N-terminal cleavage/methylation domain-containing protein